MFALGTSAQDQRGFRRNRDHIEDDIRSLDGFGVERQLVGLRTGHADGRDVDEHLRAPVTQLGLPGVVQ
ncbi:hypothetical protein D3C78_1850760 [compost metagenome]